MDNKNKIYLSFQFKNIGHRFETWSTGVGGPVVVHGLDHGMRDLSWQKWSYKVCDSTLCISFCWNINFIYLIRFFQVGLKGEAMNLASPSEISSADWLKGSAVANKQQPLTWYKVPIFISLRKIGKNGQNLKIA